MSEYNRHKWAMEWMYGGGRDPNGRGLDDEIRIGKEDWLESQRVVQGGRIGLQSGQLVQPGPGRQGYAGPKGGVFSIDEYKAIAAEYDTVLQEAFDNRTLKNVPEFKEWATTNHGEQFNKGHHRKAVTKHSKLQFDITRNKLLDTLIDEANDGFKFVKIKDLQEQAGFTRKTAFVPGKDIYGKLDTTRDKMKKGFDYLFMDSNKPAVEMFDSMRQLQKLTGISDAPSRYLKGYVPYEDSKGLIKRLAIPLSKQRLDKVPELTLGELQFRIDNKIADEKLFSAPRQVTDETKIFDIVKRHVDQGGTEIEWLKAPTKTELGYPSYNEAKFKLKGQDQVYDMAELIKNAETDSNFKQFFKVQNDLKALNSKIVTHPKTGKAVRFDKLMQEVYGYRTPYVMDHFGQVGKNPFSKLRILPTRINAAAGTLYLYDEKFITDPAKKGKYSIEGKKQALDKIGYNFQRNADDLFKTEFKLAEDVLKRGRVLRTPNQIVDSIREVKAASVIPKATKISVPAGSSRVASVAGVLDDAFKTKTAKNIGRIIEKFGKKGARFLASDWVWPEVVMAWAEYKNRKQKGQSTERARSETLKMATLGLYDQEGTEKDIIKQAKMLGYEENDIQALDNFMKINKLDEEIKSKLRTIEAMELGAVEQGVYGKAEEMEKVQIGAEGGAQALRDEVAEMEKTKESLTGFYFGALERAGDKDTGYGGEIFSKSLKSLSDTEFNASLEDRMKRRDPYGGEVGNWLTTKMFTLNYADRVAEQERIDAMGPQELREFNIERGVLPIGPTYDAYDPRKMEGLYETMGYMYPKAKGGRVSYLDGGIASLKKK